MAFNLFIAYDLIRPGQNYDRVQGRIKSLGRWYRVQYSLFYVHTHLSPDAAYRHVAAVMDANDHLAVIAANQGVLSHVPPGDIAAINNVWFSPALGLLQSSAA